MTTIQSKDLAAMFHAYGTAIFEGQHLEKGLHLLLYLIDHDLVTRGKARIRLAIDAPNSYRKLGELFEQVQIFEYLTGAERKLIQQGLKTRNLLVHSFWGAERVKRTTTPYGRKEVVTELNKLREQCRKAGQLVDSFIDQHLAKAGTSLHEASRPLWEKWQGDEDVH
jgi:hypothetical protein